MTFRLNIINRAMLLPTWGFVQVGQTEKTSAFVLLSSAVRAERLLSANEQIINFFILHSADGSGRREF